MEDKVREAGETLSKVKIDDQKKDLTEEEQEIFAELIKNGKQLTTERKIKDACDLYKQALNMYYNEKLARKIEKLEAYLQMDEGKTEGQIPRRIASDASDIPISGDNQEIYNQMISSARQLVEEGKIQDALELNKEALKICYSDKLAKKIMKMEMYLKESGEVSQGQSGQDIQQGTPETAQNINITQEEREIFDQLIQTARGYTEEGKIKEALGLYKEAIKINYSEKLAKRIAKMELFLKETSGKETEKSPDRKPQEETKAIPPSEKKKGSTSLEDQENFNQLIQTGKLYSDEGRINDALELYREAIKIYHSDKLAKKISKMEAYLKENEKPDTVTQQKEDIQKSKTPKKSQSMEDDQEKYNRLVTEAKQLISEGKVRPALDLNKEALKIFQNEKLAKKIAKMEQYLKEHGDEEDDENEDDNGMVHVGNGYFMYKELYDKLYDHQKEAVLWMWGLNKKRKGGILGDDMGLGKTIQIISFLSGLFDMDKVHATLIVMPVSLIVNWEKEFQKWAPGIRVSAYHGSSKKEKERALTKVQKRGGVLLTSYGLVVTSWETLGKQEGREFVWDYMILDEGHKIKNPTKTTKGVHAISARNRIILTGTPIQNNLKELWALFDFVHQGSLLGTARTFKMEYENPITRARERDATVGERKLGQEMAESLKKIIAPYFLRRTKAEVTETKNGKKKVTDDDSAGKMPSLTRKNDLLLWVFLTPTQQKIYEDFLSLDSVKELLMTKKSPLVALTVLKKITDHPRLLSTRAVAQLGLDDHGLDEDQLESEEAYQSAVNQINNVNDEILINESGKLIVLVELLDKLKEEGHRTLVFSQSRKLLDIVEKVISGRGHKVMRLDGTITHLSERDQRMKKFQTDDRYSVFLLTTQVGGVGLTLTAADRVIIYDPSWNPATDAQAVDRAFRIGQEKNVVIYRMITCGTVEEKIYRRQIFKDSITRQTTGNTKNPYRYFTKHELRELFQLDNPRVSKTQQQLEQMHSGYRKTDESLDAHIAYLYSLDIFGISDHDLMFGQVKDNLDDIDEDDKEASHLHGNDYIQARVQKAQELLKMESNLSQPMSHYPSTDGQTNRPRGSYEWNMPTERGPENTVDVSSGEDSDTEMVDLTETPPEKEAKSNDHNYSPTEQVKQEPVEEIDNDLPSLQTGQIKSEHLEESESQSLKIEQESQSDKLVTEIKTEPEDLANDSIRDYLNFVNKNKEPEDHSNMSEPQEDHDEIIIESDKENSIVMENDQRGSITIDSDDENKEMSTKLLKGDNSDDDVVMTKSVKTPLKEHPDKVIVDSPMKVDDDDVRNKSLDIDKSVLKSIENTIANFEDTEMNSPLQKSPLKSVETVAKGIGSAVKLFGGQISNTISSIVSMVTPERQKTPSKSRRKSVSQSPWLAKTPRSGQKNVISEELIISPDSCRPVVAASKKFNLPLTSKALTESRMNSTIMSAFGNSPTPQRSHSVGSSHSSGSSPRSIHETFVEESPSPKKRSDSNLNRNLSESYDVSRTDNSASIVVESVQNTPAVIDNQSVINDSESENTPKRPQKSENVGSIEQEINNSLEDEEINSDDAAEYKETINESVNESIKISDHHMDSPVSLMKKKKRRVVIESSDEEDDSEETNQGSRSYSYTETDKKSGKTKTLIESSDEELHSEEELESNSEDESLVKPKKNKYNPKTQVNDSDSDSEIKQKKKFIVDDENDEKDDESEDDYDEEDSFIDDGDIEESDEVSEDDDEDEEEEEEEGDDEEDGDDFDSLSEDSKRKFNTYVKDGRSFYKNGNYRDALFNILQALEIYPDNQVQALAIKINKKMEGC